MEEFNNIMHIVWWRHIRFFSFSFSHVCKILCFSTRWNLLFVYYKTKFCTFETLLNNAVGINAFSREQRKNFKNFVIVHKWRRGLRGMGVNYFVTTIHTGTSRGVMQKSLTMRQIGTTPNFYYIFTFLYVKVTKQNILVIKYYNLRDFSYGRAHWCQYQ